MTTTDGGRWPGGAARGEVPMSQADVPPGLTSARHPRAGEPSLGADDPRLNRAVEEYLAALQAGVPPDRQAFLARHAEIAAALAECLDGLEFIQAAAPQLRPSASAAVAAPAELQGRPERSLACLKLLRQVLPEQPATPCPPDSATVTGTAAAALPTSLGRFQLRRELGHGAFGIVFLAHDPHLRRDVALKVPRAEALVDPEARERFLREARAAAGLDHPNVVPVYEAGEADAVCYIASAYCPGTTLAEWLRQRDEPVPARQAAALVATLAEAVEHAHGRHVVHRDLKPGNVLLEARRTSVLACPEEEDKRGRLSYDPKITDFGLAKLLEGEPGASATGAQTESGAIVGTPCYMAPEQAGGHSREVGPAADIYALGAILYEVLAGRPPFQGETTLDTLLQVRTQEPVPPRSLRPQLPRDLETICLKCLQKAPTRRYATAQALADDLRRFLADEPVQARPVGRAERLWRWCRRHPAVAVSVVLAAVLMVGLPTTFAVSEARNASLIAQEEKKTKEEHTKTLDALADVKKKNALAQRESARLALTQGLTLCEQGDVGRGFLWLTRSLEHAVQADDPELEWAVRATLAGWRREVHTLRGFLSYAPWDPVVAFSPDGKTVVLADGNTAHCWDVAACKPFDPPLRHPSAVRAVAFTPDGQTILTSSDDPAQGGTVWRWEAATRRPLGALLQRKGMSFVPLVLSLDAKRLATIDAGGAVQVWDLAKGEPVGERLGGGGGVLALSPDGKTVLRGGEPNRKAQLWDVATGKHLFDLEHERTFLGAFGTRGGFNPDLWPVLGVAFSPDGKTALTGSLNRTARFWKVATGEPDGPSQRYPGGVLQTVFTPLRQMVLTRSTEGLIQLWDARRMAPLGQPLQQTGEIRTARLSPWGQAVLTWSKNGPAALWEVAPGQAIGGLLQHEERVEAVAFSPDSKIAATGARDNTARLWDATTGRAIRPPLRHSGRVFALFFSGDGQTLLTGCGEVMGTVGGGAVGPPIQAQLWRVATGQPVAPPLPCRYLAAARFSPDGKTAWTIDGAGSAQLWDPTTGKPVGEVRLQSTRRMLYSFESKDALAFSPDGKKLLMLEELNAVRMWDAATGASLGLLKHKAFISAFVFSPDGARVLTGNEDNTAQLWSVGTGEPLGPPLPHRGEVRALAFSPDGTKVLTGSVGSARLWDVATGRAFGPSVVQQGEFNAVAFSPDGKIFATVCDLDPAGETRGEARLWATATSTPLGPPLRHRKEIRTALAFSPDGKAILTGSYDETARLWSVPAPVRAAVKQVTVWAQVVTGLELDEHDEIRVLEPETWQQRRQRLEALGGAVLP
jgi:WD40 repeat protein